MHGGYGLTSSRSSTATRGDTMGVTDINCGTGYDWHNTNGGGVGFWIGRQTSCRHRSWLLPYSTTNKAGVNSVVAAAATSRAAYEAAMPTSLAAWYGGLDAAEQDGLFNYAYWLAVTLGVPACA